MPCARKSARLASSAQVQHIVGDEREEQLLAVQPHPTEHAPRAHLSEPGQLLEDVGEIVVADGHGSARRGSPPKRQSSLMLRKSTPSERSLRYRWVRSMPTRLASCPTLPLHKSSCCCR